MCFLPLSHTHGHKGAACLQHFLCILVDDLWVGEKKFYIILFILSFSYEDSKKLWETTSAASIYCKSDLNYH